MSAWIKSKRRSAPYTKDQSCREAVSAAAAWYWGQHTRLRFGSRMACLPRVYLDRQVQVTVDVVVTGPHWFTNDFHQPEPPQHLLPDDA